MKLLTQLYRLHSPTFGEGKMSEFIQSKLKEMGVEFKTNKNQIHSLKKNTPLISCHIDQVGGFPIRKLSIINNCITGDRNIGADDKNGIWLCLRLLEHYGGDKLSFIFSTGEEAGCEIDDVLEEYDEEILDSIRYGLVFDRAGNRDVCGESNHYCLADLEFEILRLGQDDSWHKACGVWSDADIIAYYDIPCVNLSVGYFDAHSDCEYTNLKCLADSLAFAKKLIDNLKGTFLRTDYYEVRGSGCQYFNAFRYDEQDRQYMSEPDDWGVEDAIYEAEHDGCPYFCFTCNSGLYEEEVTWDWRCSYCNDEVDELEEYEWIDEQYCTVCQAYTYPNDDGLCSCCDSTLISMNDTF